MFRDIKHILLFAAVLVNVLTGLLWPYAPEQPKTAETTHVEAFYEPSSQIKSFHLLNFQDAPLTLENTFYTGWKSIEFEAELYTETTAPNINYLLNYQAQVLVKIPLV